MRHLSMIIQPASLLLLGASIVACASNNSGYQRGIAPDYSKASTAPGWAYGADSFTVNKYQPIGRKHDYEFYYKKCELAAERAYYSKTSYECNEGPR